MDEHRIGLKPIVRVCKELFELVLADFAKSVGAGPAKRITFQLDKAVGQLVNLKRLELAGYVDNERAVRLYQKFGFELEGTRRGASSAMDNASIPIP